MKKKMIFVITGILILVYIVMFISTNSVIHDVENIMYGNVKKSFTENSPVSAYNRKDDFGTTSVNVEIKRIFVLHNFFDGYMWVNYTCEGFDNEGNRTYGDWKVPARWKIHRENGKWKIVEIKEDP